MGFAYRAVVRRVVDGDTLDLEVDLGFRIKKRDRFRLNDYNAPETRGPERVLGAEARAHIEALLPIGTEVHVETHQSDAFGRYLCDVWVELGGPRLQDDLVRDGWGVRWDGRGSRPQFNPNAPYPEVP